MGRDAGRALRLVPRRVSLRRRDVRAHALRGPLPHTSPETGAAFGFWHPDLVTMHVWLLYPNPDGVFASYNPLVKPFNRAAGSGS
jgi:hypothetical protein